MKLIEAIKERKLFYLILFSLLIRIVYLIAYPLLWWDSHVYIGMGKYIFSAGELGIWEGFRPLVHPIILGSFWKLGFNPIILGKILDLIFSILCIYFVYLISKKVFNETTGLIAAAIFSITPIFIRFTGLILTEPLAILFGLVGIYFFLKEGKLVNIFITGIFLALAFLTKFPQGIIFAAVFLTLLFTLLLRKEKVWFTIKKISLVSIGFIIPIIPYFIFNYFRYPNLLEPFISGSWIVTTDTWLYGFGILYYFIHFFLKNPLLLLFFPALFIFFKRKEWKNEHKLLLFLVPILIIIYFIYVPRKEPRYLLLAVPFLSIIITPTLINLYQKVKEIHLSKKYLKVIYYILIIIPVTLVFFFSGVIAYFYYLFVALIFFCLALIIFFFISYKKLKNKNSGQIKKYILALTLIILFTIPFVSSGVFTYFKKPVSLDKEYVNYVQENNISGAIISSNPSLMSYLDNKIIPLSGMAYANAVYDRTEDYQLIIISTCDLPCHPQDQDCLSKRKALLNQINQENTKVFYQKAKDYQDRTCEHFIFEAPKD